MSKTTARRTTQGEAKASVPDVGELAARLFVNYYKPDGGRTATHQAQVAIEAAETFVEVYQASLTKE
jgi:hypothetical protein